MTHTTQIQLFQIFRQKFGEKDAEIIVETLEKTVDNKMESIKNTFLTKEDKEELLAAIRDTKISIKDTKVDTIKWMIGLYLSLFVTLALMFIGLYIKIGN